MIRLHVIKNKKHTTYQIILAMPFYILHFELKH